MARSVADLAVVLTVIAGSDSQDPATKTADQHKTDYSAAVTTTNLKGRRFGVLKDATGNVPRLDAVFAMAVATLKRVGAEVVEVDDPNPIADTREEELSLMLAEFKTNLDGYLERTPAGVPAKSLSAVIAFNKKGARDIELFGQDLLETAERSGGADSAEHAQRSRALQQKAGPDGIDRLLTKYGLDALIAPSEAPAGRSDVVLGDPPYFPGADNLPAVAGYPHLTVPMGDVRGLPVGLSFIGTAWSERELLAYGAAFEHAAKARRAPTFPPSIDSTEAFRRLAAAGVQAQREPPVRTLTEQELVDMMVGAAIQSSRSSVTDEMIDTIKAAIAEKKVFRMVAVNDVPENWLTVVPSGVGGGGGWDYVLERTGKQNLPIEQSPMLLAVHGLSNHLGKPFQGVVRSEAGWATIDALMIASALGVPVVDGCMTGRSVPSMQQSTTFINGLSGAPGVLATRWGDTLIINKAVDDYRLEDLARGVAVASGGSVELASNTLTGAEIKRAIIPGAFSQAMLFGRAIREARERGRDPIAALVSVSAGHKLFQGTVIRSDMKREGGFNWVDVEIRGTREFSGHTYKVFVKNENLVTWLDGKPDAMAPDFIANLDPVTGRATSSEDTGIGGYVVNAEVVMVGIPASPLWRTAEGIKVVGPRAFGFDIDYVPIESRKRR